MATKTEAVTISPPNFNPMKFTKSMQATMAKHAARSTANSEQSRIAAGCPKRDLVPEHTKRYAEDAPLHPDILAAYAYVDSVVDVCDLHVGISPAWYGWALREAFLSGASHALSQQPNE